MLTPERWETAPLSDVIDHILIVYHRPLWGELRRLERMAIEVLNMHGHRDPERLNELVRVYRAFHEEMIDHMAKEEGSLFPLIRRGQGAMAGAPANVMLHEHDNAGDALRRLRELTNGYQAPPDACATWRTLYEGLEALEEHTHRHIHLENEILVRRALES